MRYNIIKHDSVQGLVNHINRLLSEGWALQGGVCTTFVPPVPLGTSMCVYTQAVTHAALPPVPPKADSVQERQDRLNYPA